MKDKIIFFVLFLTLSVSVWGQDDLLAFSGNVKNIDGSPVYGNITVRIYENSLGGIPIYDSGSDFDNFISNSQYNLMLGSGSNELTLEFGRIYYLDLEINDEDIDFGSNERFMFQSTTGTIKNISLSGDDLEVTDGNIITNTPPTAANHVATKGYVDANSGGGGVEYLGVTNATSNGHLGGLIGGTYMCKDEYGDDARMLESKDLVRLPEFITAERGWWHCSKEHVLLGDDNNYYCLGRSRGFGGSAEIDSVNCRDWSKATSSYGNAFIDDIYSNAHCSSTYPVQCVRDI